MIPTKNSSKKWLQNLAIQSNNANSLIYWMLGKPARFIAEAVPRPFIDCLKNDTEPDVTVEDGRVSVEMVLGAYQSAREGKRVTFPL